MDFSGFDPSATVTYQWGYEVQTPNNGPVFARVLEATSSSFLLARTSGKVGLEVVISRPGYETLTYMFSYLTISPPLLTNTPKPILSGTGRVGSTMTVTTGAWDNGTVLTVAWYRDDVLIRSGSSRVHILSSADFGKAITVKVTGTLTGYESAAVTSSPMQVLQGTMTAVAPSFTGTAKVGSVLTAKTSAWATGAVISYQWLLDGKAIRGATARTYKLLSTQKGKRISLTITQTAPGYVTATKTSAAIKVG